MCGYVYTYVFTHVLCVYTHTHLVRLIRDIHVNACLYTYTYTNL